MTETFTTEDVSLLLRLYNSFPALLVHLGIDSRLDVIEKLLSDEKTIEVDKSDADTVRAWVMWKSNFTCDQVTLWMSKEKEQRDIHQAAMDTTLRDLGKIASRRVVMNKSNIILENGSRILIRPAQDHAGRGLNVHNVIVEGLGRGSQQEDNIIRYLYPVFAYCSMGKWIAIR